MQLKLIVLLLLPNICFGQNGSNNLTEMMFELKEQVNIQMTMMRQSLDKVMSDNRDLKTEMMEVTKYVKTLTEDNKDWQIKNERLEDRLNEITLNKEHLLGSFISFTAYSSEVRSYQVDETVIFDQAVVNYGSFFNTTSSIFTCQLSAYYLFYVSIISQFSDSIGVRLHIDHIFLVGAFSDATNDGWDSGSMLTVIHCEEGSSVSVKVRRAGELFGSSAKEVMFTGSLLRVY